MVHVEIITTPAFRVVGKKTWIDEVEAFHRFWDQCHREGTIAELTRLGGGPGPVTGSHTFGVSRVEKDPVDRAFFFYIAAEIGINEPVPEGYEAFGIEENTWAVFESHGGILAALFEAEMYAFQQWLPVSGYRHAPAPELEVYPAADATCVQFWLPVVKA